MHDPMSPQQRDVRIQALNLAVKALENVLADVETNLDNPMCSWAEDELRLLIAKADVRAEEL